MDTGLVMWLVLIGAPLGVWAITYAVLWLYFHDKKDE